MRKLILQEWISLDGYVTDKKGQLDFFTNLNPDQNRYADEDILKFMEGIDTIILGRNTYQLFVEFWPEATSDKEIIADKLNSTSKLVFSNTLEKAPWGKWPAAQIIKGRAEEAVSKLKEEEGKDIVLWGSISLAQSLMKHKLIDEYHLYYCPTATGGGRSLFPDADQYTDLKLNEVRKYPTGVVLLSYHSR